MKKLILIMILFVQVSFAQYAVKDTVVKLSQDVLAKIDTNFSSYNVSTPSPSGQIVYVDPSGLVKQCSFSLIGAEILNNVASNSELQSLINQFESFKQEMYDSIATLRSLINTSVPVSNFDSPTNLLATGVSTSQINLSWTASTSPHDSNYIYYTTYGNDNLFSFLAKTDSGVNTYSYTGLPPQTAYIFFVKAKKGSNYSGASNPDSAITGTPVSASITQLYVGLTASGTGDGSSWANKCLYTSISNLRSTAEARATAGDSVVVWFDGGTDSVVYTSQLSLSDWDGTASHRIWLAKSVEANHNGKAVFNNSGSYGIYLSGGCTNVGLKGFIIDNADQLIRTNSSENNIHVDACTLRVKKDSGIYVSGSKNIKISNCDIRGGDGATGYDTDLVVFYSTSGIRPSGCDIWNNYFENNNKQDNNHSDVLQWNQMDGVNRIWNNIVEYRGIKNTTTVGGNAQGFYSTEQTGTWIIYNNQLVHRNPANYNGFIYVRNLPTGLLDTLIIAHNSVYVVGYSIPFQISETDLNDNAYVLVANNATHTLLTYPSFQSAGGTSNELAVNYNQFYSVGSNNITKIEGTNYTVTTLNSSSYGDGNLAEANPLFTTLTYPADLSPQAGSPLLNAGTNLQTIIEAWGLEWKTIEGTARDSSPDIGAY